MMMMSVRVRVWFGLWCLTHFQQYFSYFVAVSFIGGGKRIKTTDLPQVTDKQSKMKAWYDRNTRKRHFSPGDKVVVLLSTEISKQTSAP
jgi:hypothetical protein